MELTFHWTTENTTNQEQVLTAINIENNIKYVNCGYWVGNGQGTDGAGITITIAFKKLDQYNNCYASLMMHFDQDGAIIAPKELLTLVTPVEIASALITLRDDYDFIMNESHCPSLYKALCKYRIM